MTTRSITQISLSLLFVVSCTISVNASNIYYVKYGATGNGSSWSSPFGDLQKALHRAGAGDEIRVAGGTYLPTTTGNRSESFYIPKGVKMLGGFSGSESNAEARDWNSFPTILSGNIGSNDPEDNSYNVVTIKAADTQTILDGFVIESGYANGDRLGGAETRGIGGGLLNEGWKGKPSLPQILNCTFRNNFAKDGGAVYNNGRSGNASPSFVNCTFENNETHLDGGAIYNDGRQKGKANPQFTSCTFIGNKGNYGGAVINYGVDGEAEARFTQCYFSENKAYVKGGAVFNMSTSPLALEDYKTTIFSNNVALDHDSDNVYHFYMADKNSAVR